MRTVQYNDIVAAVEALCLKAAYELPREVVDALTAASRVETSAGARDLLTQCIDNARLAAREQMPICQDTGFAVFFVQVGSRVHVEGGLLTTAIAEGTARGYETGYLRKSIVGEPLYERRNTGDNTPPVIHLEEVDGDRITITLAPKGAGSENASAFRMLTPSEGEDAVVRFVVDTVTQAGGSVCPPTIVGVGIGGTFEKVALLAKKALVRPLGSSHPDQRYARLEARLKEELNASGVGPQGLGGTTTVLAVHVETFPCHIASLPAAVNINCHAARHAVVVL